MKDWYFKRQLKSCNECVGLYTTRISDFVFRRRRCRFPNSLFRRRWRKISPAKNLISCSFVPSAKGQTEDEKIELLNQQNN